MMEVLIIREAAHCDAQEIAKAHVSSWQSAYRNIIHQDYLNTLSIETRTAEIKNRLCKLGKHYNFIAMLHDKIIGFITIADDADTNNPFVREIGALYFLEEYWGKGFGKRVLDYTITVLRKINVQKIFLWVLEENHLARKFYEKFGFVLSGDEREVHIDKPHNELKYVYFIEYDK